MAQHGSEAGRVRPIAARFGATWRVGQFYHALMYRHDPAVDQRLRAVLQNDAQWRLLSRLSSYDRSHHLRVRDTLIAEGFDDQDMLLAAALHDVGKADDRGRVRLIHRVVNVLLKRISTRMLERLSEDSDGDLAHGMFLARHHARLGADLVAATGAGARCCEMIARHEDPTPGDDAQLAALIQADERTLA